jgi:shikimate kinase
VLVGLSGAGKSAVAGRLARLLGWELLDLDAEVERAAGRPIAAIFEDEGEDAFRELEGRVTRSAGEARGTVVATGGGWMARPELRDMWPGAARVWLRVEPARALERLASERLTRPLLAGPDPLAALTSLLEVRLPAYSMAEYTVATGGRTPDEVAEAILAMLKRRSPGTASPDNEYS